MGFCVNYSAVLEILFSKQNVSYSHLRKADGDLHFSLRVVQLLWNCLDFFIFFVNFGVLLFREIFGSDIVIGFETRNSWIILG